MAQEHGTTDDQELVAALYDALAGGGIEVGFGRIAGHGGYYSPAERTVRLNPDTTPDEQRTTLLDALRRLTPPRPRLRLIQGGAS